MISLDEALKAAEERKEFVINRYDGLVAINYVIQLPDSFEGIRREFRGITFSEKTGQLISLPLHKFLNINQSEETQWDKLKDQSGNIYEKLDGSMIHFFMWNGEVRAATRMSANTEQAAEAMKIARKKRMLDDIAWEIHNGYTPIFEYVAPNNQIVVEYSKPRLVYLHSRQRSTGKYTNNPVYRDRAKMFRFEFADIMNHLDKQEFEGYVACLDSGLWVKCKCPWYLERHRVVDAFMRPAYRLFEIVYEGMMDDLIAAAPDKYKDKLKEIYKEAQEDLLQAKELTEATAKDILQLDIIKSDDKRRLRKNYALYCQHYHKNDVSLFMAAFDKKDLTEIIQKKLMEIYKVRYPNRLSSTSIDEE